MSCKQLRMIVENKKAFSRVPGVGANASGRREERMTFTETRDLLKDLKAARKYACRLKRDLKELESDYGALHASGEREIAAVGVVSSPVERIVVRIEKAREGFARALERVFDLEDQIAEAMEGLTYEEKNILTDYYMRDRTHYQLAREYGYTDRNIKYMKNKAIKRLSERLR